MLPKRFSEILWKYSSVFQPFRKNPYFYYSTSSLNTNRNDLKLNYEKVYEESSNQEKTSSYNSGNSHNYSYNGRYIHTISLLPLFFIATHQLNNNVSCLFSSNRPEKNKLTNRVALIQYPSNNPIEDRWAVSQLQTIPAYVAMVFDGHGGWQVADYARENMTRALEDALKANKEKTFANEDEYITASIKDAFDKIENEFLAICRQTYKAGFPETGKVGACALVTIVYGNKVYSANAGDCKGVICKTENGKVAVRKVNHKQNADSKKEQKRLREQFKDEDIYVCKRGNEACYVKGRLQPTRSLGDFHLKHEEFNNPKNIDRAHGYRAQMKNFNGPYITHVPEVKIFELEKNDKYLILSSDGMWDELTKNDVAKIVQDNSADKQKLTTGLLNSAIQVAGKRRDMSEDEIREIPLGQRRRYHDDMTIIVVDLENQGN